MIERQAQQSAIERQLRWRGLAFGLLGLGASTQFTIASPVRGQGSGPEVRLIEDMRLDGNKESFAVVFAAAAGPQNRLALWFPQESKILIYSGTGALIASIGRRGEGPGEFSNSLRGMRWVGDSLWVNDVLLSRETVISSQGKVIRTRFVPKLRPQTSRLGVQEMFPFTAHMRAADGAVLGSSIIARAENASLVNARTVMRVKDDTVSQLLAVVPSADPRWESALAYLPQAAYSPVGALFAHAQVNELAVRGGSVTVSVFRATDGDTVFASSFPYDGVLLPRRVADSIAKARRPRDPDGRPLPPQALDPKRVPPVHVPLRQLLLGSDGRAWAVVREPGDSLKAIAISQRGVSAWFKLPSTARIMAASATHIWLREEDEDGVQSVVRYRFGS